MRLGSMRVRDWFGLGAFYCGLGAIGAAGGLYLVYDRLSVGASLPPNVRKLCAGSGKKEVALAGVFLGLTLMLVGASIPRSRSKSPKLSVIPRPRTTTVPLYIPPDRPEIEASVTSYGRVVLRTERYVAAKSRAPDRTAPRSRES